MSICQQAILVAKQNLIPYVEIQYTATSNLTAVAVQVRQCPTLTFINLPSHLTAVTDDLWAALPYMPLPCILFSPAPHNPQINGTVALDAVVGCMTSSEAQSVYKLLDTYRKPVKNYFLVTGPNIISWNTAVGSISQVRK